MSDLRAAAADLYSIAVGEHGHNETHAAIWPSCLPAHMAFNRYRDATYGVYVGPIEHSNSMCQKQGCECWCQACERHNWRHAQVTA